MTMTLDELKEAVADICAGCDSERSLFTNADLGDAIDAAIRERDRLRGTPVPKVEWQELTERVERAQSELAALKARIADSRTTDVFESEGHAGMVAMGGLPCEWIGKNVRLVVED